MELILCPRGKKGKGRRVNLSATIDGELFDKLQEYHDKGFNISHIIDSALWTLFDKPPLSFEMKDNEDRIRT